MAFFRRHVESAALPIGSIVAWAKSLTGAPSLQSNFAECNGQSLSDSGSVFDGVTLPSLNGNSETTKKFLRGSTASGSAGSNAQHLHAGMCSSTEGSADVNFDGSTGCFYCSSSCTANASHIPPYYEVVYIIRIK